MEKKGYETSPEITVEEFLRKNPNATVDMMTPGGFVLLSPEQSQALLKGSPVSAHPGVLDAARLVYPDELLPQRVVTINKAENKQDYFDLFTEDPPRTPEKNKAQSAKQPMSDRFAAAKAQAAQYNSDRSAPKHSERGLEH